MTQRTRIALALGALLIIGAAAFAYIENLNPSAPDPAVSTGTTTSATITEPRTAPQEEPVSSTSSEHGYGTLTIRLNEAASFPGGLSIRPTAVLEDSRCPVDATCIQAGTVRVSARIRSGTRASAYTFEPGTTVTTHEASITLLSVSPSKRENRSIADADYRFTFKVEKRLTQGGGTACYVGGCSSQLCTDKPDMTSTCEYRPEYACYRKEKCERQADGECGWTQTKELASCLKNPPGTD